MSGMLRRLIASVVALCVLSGCQGIAEFMRDPGGDDRIFAGDPAVFLGKKVVVQFRWGDRRMYGAMITCVVLDVEEDAIIVRGLYRDAPWNVYLYSRLLRLGKLLPVEGQPDVFRIRRDDICRIFEADH